MGSVLIVLRLLDAIVAVTGAIPQVQALQAKMTQFKNEGREPTPDEWEALFAEIESDSNRLDAADKGLNR